MKRIVSFAALLAILVLVSVIFSAKPVYATDVYINGQKTTFTSNPLNVNGRLLVPMGEFFKALSAEVEWDAANNCVKGSTGSSQVLLYINSTTAFKNGQTIELDAPPLIVNGRTMVPLGFIAQSFGCQVTYDGDNDRVVLTTEEKNSTTFAPPKVFLDGYEYACPLPRLINGTLVLGLYMTNSRNDYAFIESGHILTYFYPGSRKVDVYQAHVNSAGLTDKMDLLESFEMDIDPIFCWNEAHDRIDYVMVPLKLYAKAAVCKVEYDNEKNIINIDRGISMNIACSGITAVQKPIYNTYSAFNKSEDVYIYYKTSYPIRAETLVSVFTYGIGNRWEEVYREDIVAKDKDCFCIKLPKDKL